MTNGAPPRLPRLLVCEGAEDKYFFHWLIANHSLPRFHIVDAHGNGNFSQAINAFKLARRALYNGLSDILIVADNDEAPATNFQNVCGHIERIFGAGTAPRSALHKTATRPRVAVLMIPWENENGHLERLCLDAAKSANGLIAQHTDTFMSLLAAARWQNESRFAKAWLRANLAARCARDPFVALGHVFNDSQYQPLIPLNHPSFNRIVGVLRTF